MNRYFFWTLLFFTLNTANAELTPDSVLNTYSLYGVQYITKTGGAAANTSPGGAIGSAGPITIHSSPIKISHNVTTPQRFAGGVTSDTVTGSMIAGNLQFGEGGGDAYLGKVYVSDSIDWDVNDGGKPRIGGEIQIANSGAIRINAYNKPYFNGVQYAGAQTRVTASTPGVDQANVSWVSAAALPQAPVFTTTDFPDTVVAAGTTDITLPNGSSLTLPPGPYGNLDIGFGATLNLTSGVYSFNNVNLAGDDSRIIVDVSSGNRAVIVVNGIFTNGNAQAAKPCMIQTRADTGKGMEDFYGFLMMVMHQTSPLNLRGGEPGSLRISATISVPNTKVILNSGIALFGQIFAEAIEMSDFQGGTLGQFHKFDPIIPTIKLATANGGALEVAENDPDSRVITVPIQLSHVNGMDVSVDYLVISKSGAGAYATIGQDFDTTTSGVKGSGTLVFPTNSLTPITPVQFYLINDELVETPETLFIALRNPVKCKLSAPDTLTDTISIIITSEDIPRAPTDMSLSNATVQENQSVHTFIGKFTAVDPDNTPPFSYSLVAGVGDSNNVHFLISNDSLFSASEFDYETTPTQGIRVRVTDNDARFYEEAFVIQIVDVNDIPTITVLIDTTILEDGTTGLRAFSISDAETPFVNLIVTVSTSNPSLVPLTGISLSGTGANRNITVVPLGDSVGTSTITVTVQDAAGAFATTTWVLTVDAVNDKPVAIDDAISMDEDTPKMIAATDLSNNDNDTKDAGSVSVTAVFAPVNGTVSLASGTITFTPTLDFHGTASFQYEITDVGNPAPGLKDTATVTVSINAVNDKPIAFDDAITTDEDTQKVIAATDISSNDNDTKDAGSVTVTAVFAPVNGTVSLASGTITFTPNLDFHGTASFQYEITDAGNPAPGLKDTATVTVTVNAVNDNPVAFDDAITTDEDTQKVFASNVLSSNDNDTKDAGSVNVTAVFSPVNGSVSLVGGTITFTPSLDFHGTASFQYEITDAGSPTPLLKDTATVTVTVNAVNDKPVAFDDAIATDEDTQKVIASTILSSNDNDIKDAGSVHVTAVFSPVNGSVSLAGGNITFTPALDFHGVASFQYEITDAGNPTPGLKDTATVTVTVNAVNDKPVAFDDAIATDEDAPKVIAATDLSSNDNDTKDAGSVNVTAVFLPVNGNVSLTGGNITFTPFLDFHGTASFQYEITDIGSPTPGLKDTATVTVTVNAVNDKPVAFDDAIATDEDAPKVIAATDLSSNDNDTKDAGSVNVTAVFSPVNGAVSLVSGTLTFTPSLDFHGTASFQYEITDIGSPTPGLKDTATVTVTVNAVNDKPEAFGDAIATDEDTPKVFASTVLSNNDNDSKDAGSVNVTAVFSPVNGTVSLSGGNITFTPFLDFHGTASFQYEITDIGSPTPGLKDTATVTVTVNAVNDKPVAFDDAIATDEDAPKVIAATDLSSNDDDTKDAGSVNVTAVFSSVNGTVSFASGTITFTPNLDFHGTASFQYEITDAGSPTPGLKDTATVTVTVNAVNDKPVAFDDAIATDEDTPKVIAAILLSGNDNDSKDMGSVQVSKVFAATHGTVSLVGGVITFTPDSDFHGIASFEYEITDSGSPIPGLKDTATVTVTVNAVNDPAVVVSQTNVSTLEDISLGINLSMFSVVDVDNNYPTGFSLRVGAGSHYTVSGTSIVPYNNYVGVLTVPVRLFDGTDSSEIFDLKVTVIPVNDAPSFDLTKSLVDRAESSPAVTVVGFAENILAGPADEVGQQLHFELVNDNSALFLVQPSVDEFGTLTFTPTPNVSDVANVTIRLYDDGGVTWNGVDSSSSKSFKIVITPVNNPPVFVEGPDVEVLEDAPAQTIAWAAGISAGPNEDHQQVHFVVSNDKPSLFLVQPSIDPNGFLRFTPGVNQNGFALVKVRLVDDGGTLADGIDSSLESTFRITILPVNDPPILAVIPSQTTREDAPWNYTANANDVDIPETLVYSLSKYPVGLTIHPQSGVMSWIASNAQVGTHSVTVVVADKGGLKDSTSFTISVTNTNDAPQLIAVPDTTILEDVSSRIRIKYTEDDLGDSVSFQLLTYPVGASVHSSSGEMVWTPVNADVGVHTVVVRISDKAGATDLDTFLVTVLNVNDAPELGDVHLAVAENARVGANIGKVPATDIDMGAKLVFTMIDGSERIMLRNDGMVQVAKTLDYESAKTETLLVVVSDGMATDTGTYVVEILDIPELTDVEILKVVENDSTWITPDSVWTNDTLVDVTWKHDDYTVTDRVKVSDGINVIIREFLTEGKDTWGRDTVIIVVNRKVPEVVLVVPPQRKPPTAGTIVEEPVDVDDVFYINTSDQEIFGRIIVIGKDLTPDTLMIRIYPDLVEGENEVTYSWTDVFGNTSVDTVTVILDTQAPVVRIVHPLDGTVTSQYVVPVDWMVEGNEMDTLNLQSLVLGENQVVRTYRDRAGNEGSDTVYVNLKDGKKNVRIELEDPLVLLDQKKIDRYYKVNPPEEGEYFALSLVNAKTGKEEEALIGKGSSVKKADGSEPYPGLIGTHLGPTLQVDLKLPAMGGFDAAGKPRGGNLASIIEEDGRIALTEGAGDTRELVTVEEYLEKHCLDGAFEGLSGDALMEAPLYQSRLRLEVMIYDGIGQFVDRIIVHQVIDSPDYLNDANRVALYLELKPNKDAQLRNQRGRAYGTGAYVLRGSIEAKSTLKCDLPSARKGSLLRNENDILKTFGFRRDR